jgi:hypothetical protein
MTSKLKKGAAFTAVLGLTFTIGIAFAAWTANGTGTGFAKAKAKVDLTTGTATPTEDLYPGATGAVAINAINNNPYPVLITAVSLNGTAALDCGVTFIPKTGLSQYVPANGTATFSLANAVSMASDAPDSCAGQTITIPISFTGTSTTPQSAAPTLNDTPIVDTHPNWTIAAGQTAQLYSGQGLGETFTRASSGTVTGAAVYFWNGGGVSNASAEVKVWSVNANGSLGSPISTQTVSGLTPTTDQWLLLALPTPVAVADRFAITILPSWSSSTSYVAIGTSNPYAGGSLVAGTATWSVDSGTTDLRIRVYGS